MTNTGIIWVVELRRSPKDSWEFQAAYETRSEAKEHGWVAEPPGEMRISKYVAAKSNP